MPKVANPILGIPSHNPTCRCAECRAFRRKAKADAGTIGPHTLGSLAPVEGIDVTASEDLLDADQVLVTTNPRITIRHRIAAWIAMRAAEPNITLMEASSRMGLAPKTLTGMISKATKEGWLRFYDPLDRLEHEIIPQTMDNLVELLNDGDKQTTIEVAKGTIFRTYQAAKGITDQPTTVLALKIETLSHDQEKVLTGHVVGKSKAIDIQVEPNEA